MYLNKEWYHEYGKLGTTGEMAQWIKCLPFKWEDWRVGELNTNLWLLSLLCVCERETFPSLCVAVVIYPQQEETK